MKLSTIWTLRGMAFRERLNRTSEAGILWLAAHLPRRLAYWSFIVTANRAMKSTDVVPEVRFMDMLQRADGGPR
jgi:hypothetical protein